MVTVDKEVFLYFFNHLSTPKSAATSFKSLYSNNEKQIYGAGLSVWECSHSPIAMLCC